MISADKLMSYLPWYYQESRVMRSIMEAIAPELPDAIGHLWKAFFLHLAKDDEELLKYYQEELQTYELAALFGKLRSGGVLNKELLAKGIEAVDTHIYSPESGYVLSGEEAVFPDGVYYAPLIVDLWVDPELISIARQMVAEAGTAGMRYWFSVLIRETARLPTHDANFCRAILPSVLLPLRYEEEISGRLRVAILETSIEMQTSSKIATSTAREETGFWLDLPMLVEYAAKQGLTVVPDALTMLAPSQFGEFSRDGVLASGQKEDITVCLVSGDLTRWLSLPVKYTRHTWQIGLEEAAGIRPASSSADQGKGIGCSGAGSIFISGFNARLSGEDIMDAVAQTVGIEVGADLTRPAWWSPAVTFLEEWVTFLDSTLAAQAATIEQQP